MMAGDSPRTGLTAGEPTADIEVKRFAPYPVRLGMRLLTMVGIAMALGWFLHAIYALFRAVDGVQVGLLPVWIFVAGGVLGAQTRGWRGNVPPFGEFLGNRLASKQCPACGQSIFNHMPPSGYAAETTGRAWWPSRYCTNCGHDTAKRTARLVGQETRR